MVIGITGGSGVGKTTVLNIFKSHGAYVIDCDKLYHEMLTDSTELKSKLISEFGQEILDSLGNINTKLLGKIVFNDANKLNKLNCITHSFIALGVKHLLQSSKQSIIVIDASELLSTQLKDECDTIIGIIAPVADRISRIIKRDGISEEYAISRINSQKDDKYFENNCDYIINNNKTLESLVEESKELLDTILKQYG